MQKPATEFDKRRGTRTIRWRVQVKKIVDGKVVVGWKRESFSCGTDKKLYDKKYEEIQKTLWAQQTHSVTGHRLAEDCYKAFIAERRMNSYEESTLTTYSYSIPPLFRIPGIVRMDDITEQRLKDWKTVMLTEGLAPGKGVARKFQTNTVRRRFRDVCTWLNWAVANGWIQENPYSAIIKAEAGKTKRGGFLPRHQPKPRFYTNEEIIRIENVLDLNQYSFYYEPKKHRGEMERRDVSDFRAIVRLMYMAGLRTGEACMARFDCLTVHPEGDGELIVSSLKGGEEKKRIVPLIPKVIEALPKRGEGYLFSRWLNLSKSRVTVHRQKVKWWSDKLIELAELKRIDGLPAPTLYGLRHTFARLYLESGEGEKALAEIMGHTSLEMIAKIYGHLSKSHLRESVNRMLLP